MQSAARLMSIVEIELYSPSAQSRRAKVGRPDPAAVNVAIST
jgi:hypothetical protein